MIQSKRSILQTMLDKLDLEYNAGIAEASVYKMGMRTGPKGAEPMVIRETNCEKADRLERLLGPRMNRLRRLIEIERRAGR